MKVTQWFQPEEKPVHVGWYESEGYTVYHYWWWNGECWTFPQDGFICSHQDRTWRGLAEKPEKMTKREFAELIELIQLHEDFRQRVLFQSAP